MAKGADPALTSIRWTSSLVICYKIDIKFDDEDKALMLLTHLSVSYEHLVKYCIGEMRPGKKIVVLGNIIDLIQQKVVQ